MEYSLAVDLRVHSLGGGHVGLIMSHKLFVVRHYSFNHVPQKPRALVYQAHLGLFLGRSAEVVQM